MVGLLRHALVRAVHDEPRLSNIADVHAHEREVEPPVQVLEALEVDNALLLGALDLCAIKQ